MSYGGSGGLEQTNLWTYQPGTGAFECIATAAVTNDGDVRILDRGSLAGYMITANFIWNFAECETHFSPHRYQLEVRRFDKASGSYKDTLLNVTRKKYPSLDDNPGPIDVVELEQPNILHFLKSH